VYLSCLILNIKAIYFSPIRLAGTLSSYQFASIDKKCKSYKYTGYIYKVLIQLFMYFSCAYKAGKLSNALFNVDNITIKMRQ